MKRYVFISVLLLCSNCFTQDTVFVRSLPLIGRVSNISTDNHYLYVRVKDSVYKWDNGFFPLTEAKLNYSWVEKGNNELIINHTKYISKTDRIEPESVSGLIPGRSINNISSATVGKNLYLCYNGNVLEYKVNPNVKVHYSGESIRHIYTEHNLRITSTYNGIFIDTLFNNFSTTEIDPVLASYSNGELNNIDSNYYLCQDNLLKYNVFEKKFETLINTEGAPRFRKIFKLNNKLYGIFDSAFGQFSIEKGIVLEFYEHASFTDYEIIEGKVFLSSEDRGLFVFDPDNETIINIDCPSNSINDLLKKENSLFLGTENGVLQLNDDQKTFESIFAGKNVLQLLFYQEAIIFTSDDCLMVYYKNNIVTLVENIEFNKMALLIDEHFLYAGSVSGLYTIETTDLKHMLRYDSHRINDTKIQKSTLIFYLVLIVSCILIIAAVFLYINKSNRTRVVLQTNLLLSKESCINLIKNNKSILSVEDIADYYNTSITQLNRKLKKENTIALSLMKDVKKEIATEMYKEGKTLDEISKRVGYSNRYVREKLLA